MIIVSVIVGLAGVGIFVWSLDFLINGELRRRRTWYVDEPGIRTIWVGIFGHAGLLLGVWMIIFAVTPLWGFLFFMFGIGCSIITLAMVLIGLRTIPTGAVGILKRLGHGRDYEIHFPEGIAWVPFWADILPVDAEWQTVSITDNAHDPLNVYPFGLTPSYLGDNFAAAINKDIDDLGPTIQPGMNDDAWKTVVDNSRALDVRTRQNDRRYLTPHVVVTFYAQLTYRIEPHRAAYFKDIKEEAAPDLIRNLIRQSLQRLSSTILFFDLFDEATYAGFVSHVRRELHRELWQYSINIQDTGNPFYPDNRLRVPQDLERQPIPSNQAKLVIRAEYPQVIVDAMHAAMRTTIQTGTEKEEAASVAERAANSLRNFKRETTGKSTGLLDPKDLRDEIEKERAFEIDKALGGTLQGLSKFADAIIKGLGRGKP